MTRLFAIGDIHGCSKTLRKLLIDELQIKPADEVYLVGDYIDRGPDSKGVIDLIIFLKDQGYIIHTLRGNHEQMMLDAFNDKPRFNHWMINGGEATMSSFNLQSLQQLDTRYIEFLNQTQYYFETPKYVLVHAGLNFNFDDPFQDKEAMLWIRNTEIDSRRINGRVIIHGHTPKLFNQIMGQLSQNDLKAIDIDGGCVYKNRPGMGNLFAINLTDMKFIGVSNID